MLDTSLASCFIRHLVILVFGRYMLVVPPRLWGREKCYTKIAITLTTGVLPTRLSVTLSSAVPRKLISWHPGWFPVEAELLCSFEETVFSEAPGVKLCLRSDQTHSTC